MLAVSLALRHISFLTAAATRLQTDTLSIAYLDAICAPRYLGVSGTSRLSNWSPLPDGSHRPSQHLPFSASTSAHNWILCRLCSKFSMYNHTFFGQAQGRLSPKRCVLLIRLQNSVLLFVQLGNELKCFWSLLGESEHCYSKYIKSKSC